MNVSVKSITSLSNPVLVSIGVTVTSILGGIAVVIWLIFPLRERYAVAQKEVSALQSTLTTMNADIKKTDEQVRKTAQLKLKRDEWITTGTLVPYLGSLWMGAKSLMGPVAQTTGFKLEGVKDYPPILLRLPTPVPETIYARQPIEFIGRGSFDQIIGFIQETEKKYPLTILSGLVILTQLQTPECHKAVITFEWPVKHEWLLLGPAGQK